MRQYLLLLSQLRGKHMYAASDLLPDQTFIPDPKFVIGGNKNKIHFLLIPIFRQPKNTVCLL